jgi:hypothetical protein
LEDKDLLEVASKFPAPNAILEHFRKVLKDLPNHVNDNLYLQENIYYLEGVFESYMEEKNMPALKALVSNAFFVAKRPDSVLKFVFDSSLMSIEMIEPIWKAITSDSGINLRLHVAEFVFREKDYFLTRDDAFWKRVPGLANEIFSRFVGNFEEIIWGIRSNPFWVLNVDASEFIFERPAVVKELLDSVNPKVRELGYRSIHFRLWRPNLLSTAPAVEISKLSNYLFSHQVVNSDWDQFVKDVQIPGLANFIDPRLLRMAFEQMKSQNQHEYIKSLIHFYNNLHPTVDPTLKEIVDNYFIDSLLA